MNTQESVTRFFNLTKEIIETTVLEGTSTKIRKKTMLFELQELTSVSVDYS
jgi:hypothetical protein